MQSSEKKLEISLLLLRLGVFIVMFFWTLDKFLNPGHAAAVFSNFYLLEGLESTAFVMIGSVQMLVVLGFAAGLFRPWTYGLVLAMHAISTFSSWKQYLEPFDNLLFFAAWPMLAACIVLFLLREDDRLLNLDAWRKGDLTGG
ncbi:MAG: hypothetical protein ACLFUF_07730 [Opitutales bacterium]